VITAVAAEFLAALPGGGVLAGLDVGTKTIGLALCDSGWSFAGPAETIRRTKFTADLARNLAALALPLLLWDERWSTQAVERAMIAADVSRAKRAEAVDKLAAAHILQGALDALCMLPRSS
jgi:putative Holliday junction resolvase